MSGSGPWIVGVLVTVFVTLAGSGGVLVERIRRRSNTADQKVTETGLALAGFKDLVQDLQEERAALKAEVADLKAQLKKGRGGT